MTTIDLPKCWQKYKNALEGGIDRIILFGPSGTGKTYGGSTTEILVVVLSDSYVLRI